MKLAHQHNHTAKAPKRPIMLTPLSGIILVI
uniref:Uncharacterized protein n=1 Tax=Rhizophora mucronata TaxID=61149 RepID=A0A2P2QDP5_RHIMU